MTKKVRSHRRSVLTINLLVIGGAAVVSLCMLRWENSRLPASLSHLFAATGDNTTPMCCTDSQIDATTKKSISCKYVTSLAQKEQCPWTKAKAAPCANLSLPDCPEQSPYKYCCYPKDDTHPEKECRDAFFNKEDHIKYCPDTALGPNGKIPFDSPTQCETVCKTAATSSATTTTPPPTTPDPGSTTKGYCCHPDKAKYVCKQDIEKTTCETDPYKGQWFYDAESCDGCIAEHSAASSSSAAPLADWCCYRDENKIPQTQCSNDPTFYRSCDGILQGEKMPQLTRESCQLRCRIKFEQQEPKAWCCFQSKEEDAYKDQYLCTTEKDSQSFCIDIMKGELISATNFNDCSNQCTTKHPPVSSAGSSSIASNDSEDPFCCWPYAPNNTQYCGTTRMKSNVCAALGGSEVDEAACRACNPASSAASSAAPEQYCCTNEGINTRQCDVTKPATTSTCDGTLVSASDCLRCRPSAFCCFEDTKSQTRSCTIHQRYSWENCLAHGGTFKETKEACQACNSSPCPLSYNQATGALSCPASDACPSGSHCGSRCNGPGGAITCECLPDTTTTK